MHIVMKSACRQGVDRTCEQPRPSGLAEARRTPNAVRSAESCRTPPVAITTAAHASMVDSTALFIGPETL